MALTLGTLTRLREPNQGGFYKGYVNELKNYQVSNYIILVLFTCGIISLYLNMCNWNGKVRGRRKLKAR